MRTQRVYKSFVNSCVTIALCVSCSYCVWFGSNAKDVIGDNTLSQIRIVDVEYEWGRKEWGPSAGFQHCSCPRGLVEFGFGQYSLEFAFTGDDETIACAKRLHLGAILYARWELDCGVLYCL